MTKKIIEYSKPGTMQNPKRPNFDKRPERFVEPIVLDYLDNDIVFMEMWLRITKEERWKIDGLCKLIQEYLDKT